MCVTGKTDSNLMKLNALYTNATSEKSTNPKYTFPNDADYKNSYLSEDKTRQKMQFHLDKNHNFYFVLADIIPSKSETLQQSPFPFWKVAGMAACIATAFFIQRAFFSNWFHRV